MKGGMAVLGESGRAREERVVGRVLGGRLSSEDFMVVVEISTHRQQQQLKINS